VNTALFQIDLMQTKVFPAKKCHNAGVDGDILHNFFHAWWEAP